MITLVEALNYRCLRHISQSLAPFHVLVGPNASGKTTFLDVISFLGDVVKGGPEFAVSERNCQFEELLWMRQGDSFELAIEARIPENLRQELKTKIYDTIRYDVRFGTSKTGYTVEIQNERVLLKQNVNPPNKQSTQELFPSQSDPPKTISPESKLRGTKTVLSKTPGGNDFFRTESKTKGWQQSFRLGPGKSTLGNLPEDESNYPASTWLKNLLQKGVQHLVLDSQQLKLASPPNQSKVFQPDGSNLPWIIADLKKNSISKYDEWIAHLRTALPDITGIEVIRRADDGFSYIVVSYDGGLEIPSWVVSDGTLRVLALTLLAYLPGFSGVVMVEEPENGIHPKAINPVIQSLSSVYDAQILLATHSPVVLSEVEAKEVLCFAKTDEGATDIVLGSEHPMLRDWQKEVDLSVLFAAGVLG